MPIIDIAPGYTVFVEFNTTIPGVCGGGRWMGELAILACQANPKLLAELKRRCRAQLAGVRQDIVLPHQRAYGILPSDPPKPDASIKDPEKREVAHARAVEHWKEWRVPPIAYVDEKVDRWRALGMAAETFVAQCWNGDCGCISAWWLAFFFFCMTENVGIGISQPKTKPCDKACEGGAKGGCAQCGYGMAHEFTVLCFEAGLPVPEWFIALCVEVDPALVLRDQLPGRTPDRIRDAIAAGSPVLAFDGSVYGGMGATLDESGKAIPGPPGPKFYGSGESSFRWID